MPNKERPIIFSSEMVKAILDGRKTMTRRIIKENFIYSLTDEWIYGIHTGKTKGYQNEIDIKTDSDFAEQRLYGWLGWTNLLTETIQRFWENGVRGLVSVKRTRHGKRLQNNIIMPQQQKSEQKCSSVNMYGFSRDAAKQIYAGETFGWNPRELQAEQSVLGNTGGKLARQENSRERKRRRKPSNGKINEHRMRTFEVGCQNWFVQSASSCPGSKNVAGWHISYCQFQKGMKLCVRENICTICYLYQDGKFAYGKFLIEYVADKTLAKCSDEEWWQRNWRKCPGTTISSRFMPKWAARIRLEITGIRVERIKEISDKDIICEGFETREDFYGTIIKLNRAKNPKDFLNKWVWVIEFPNKKV